MASAPPLAIPSRERRESSLLSPVDYDADAISIRSDQDTDSEDDQLQERARTSAELRARDRLVFLEEDEVDKLVTDARRRQERERRGSNLPIPNPLKFLSRRSSDASLSRSPARGETGSSENLISEKRQQRRNRRRRRKEQLLADAQNGEDGELMYEMEQGGIKDGSSTGESSDREESEELDRKGLKLFADAKTKRRRTCCRWLFIHTLIAIAFALLVLVAWKLSLAKKAERVQQLVSNGTALFAPTTIIISLDGFRADFLNRGITPRLNAFIKEGISPLYMLPSFPSVTFPNHYTLATGLYPESHGVVGNTFYDPELKTDFYYTDPDRSLDPKWWGGEPFWVTAERSGIRSAIHMWPGSEAHILGVEPSFLDKFNGKEKLPKKVKRILEFLDKPGQEDETAKVADMRPQLIAAYVPNVDGDGHKYGPNSTEIRDTIKAADDMLEELFQGLERRNLTHIVNVIVVSDHGMATTDTSRLMQLDDLVDLEQIEHIDGWPLVGLRPRNSSELVEIYDGVVEKTKENPNVEVYLRDVNMPERYHFSNNDRIAPLWIVPKTGWNLAQKKDFDIQEAKANNLVYHPRGLHGYDHEHPLMRAIFVARGPAFPHKPNSRLEAFQNIEVYNILCDSIGMEPIANNGTLRLPLRPIGLHDVETPIEEPADPVTSYTLTAAPTRPALVSQSSPDASGTRVLGVDPVSSPKSEASNTVQVDPVQPSSVPTDSVQVDPPVPPPSNKVDDDKEGSDDDDKSVIDKVEDAAKGVWGWFTEKVDHIWSKITGSD